MSRPFPITAARWNDLQDEIGYLRAHAHRLERNRHGGLISQGLDPDDLSADCSACSVTFTGRYAVTERQEHAMNAAHDLLRWPR